MAWAQNLLECSFRGVVFDVVATRERIARATSVSEYPYVNGGEVEDLGARPVPFTLQAVWFGEDYEDRLRAALDAFNVTGAGELIHPVWGSVKNCQFLSADLAHAATEPDSCTVSLEFIESALEAVFWQMDGAAQCQETIGAPGDAAVDASVDAVEDVVATLHAQNPLAVLDDLRQSMLGPLLAMSAEVSGVLTAGLDVLDYPRAWARDIASLSNGLLDTANFPGRLVSEWTAITDTLKGIGDDWADNSESGYSPWVRGSVPSEGQAQSVARSYMAVSMATAQADATAIVLAAEAVEPTLSPIEIESLTNDTRSQLQAAIEATRRALPLERARTITEPLKDQALAVQNAAQAIIEARPPLVQRTLTAPGNLRLVAHKLYGDHTRAPELLRLNKLREPNALKMGDVLYAYAR